MIDLYLSENRENHCQNLIVRRRFHPVHRNNPNISAFECIFVSQINTSITKRKKS